MSYRILAYDEENYRDHVDAKDSGALYKTSSTMDAIETRGGLLDLLEMSELFSDVSGKKNIAYGVMSGIHFINLIDIKKQLENNHEDASSDSMDALEAIEAILEYREGTSFSVSAKAILGNTCSILESSVTGKPSTLDDVMKMNVIKQVGRAVLEDRSIEIKFPEEIKIIKDEMAIIQKKEFYNTFQMG